MSARFAEFVRVPLIASLALFAAGLTLMLAAGPAIALPVAAVPATVSANPSAVSPGVA